MHARRHVLCALAVTALWASTLAVPAAAQTAPGPVAPPATAGPRPSKVADVLRQVSREVGRERGAGRSGAGAGNALVRTSAAGEVEVLVHAAAPLTAAERRDLRALGARPTAEVGDPGTRGAPVGMVQAWLPATRVDAVAALPWVVAVTAPGYGTPDDHPTNAVNSQGVALHRADDVQARGIDGTGVTVGVISDGVTNLAAAAAELPAVNVLATGTGDEGTAMLEIVHDVAPGAALAFSATGGGTAAHIASLNALVAAGANVITEDIAFDSEPAFQRGAVAQAGDTIAAAGVPVHSSAGNLAQNHAARVTATGTGTRPDGTATTTFTGCANTPDNVVAVAPSGDTTFDVQIPAIATGAATSATVTLQWSEPRSIAPTAGQGGFTDLNLYLMDAGLTRCLAQSTGVQANGVGDTLEQLTIARTAAVVPAKIVVDVQGTSSAVAAPVLDLRWRGAGSVDATTRAGSLNPDSNYTGPASSSAAVDAQNVTAGLGALEGFSAAGPVQLGVTTQCPGGTAGPCAGVAGGATTPALDPAWAAADDVAVSGAGGFGTPFFGTSAAAPHAAACDALLRDALGTPAAATATTRARLVATAVDVAPAGTDPATGGGQLDCLAAVNRPPVASAGGPYTTSEGTDVVLTAAASSDPDTTATFTDTLTYAWDLDGDGAYDDATGATPSFTQVGQDGVRTVAVQVTDTAGATAVASTTVTVTNVAPMVVVASVAPVAEGTSVRVSGTVTDPGWEDLLTATIDLGDGVGVRPLTGTYEGVRPDATLAFAFDHTYGDDGTFSVTVCGRDDDTSVCSVRAVTVTNVLPDPTIDTTGTTLLNGVPTLVTHAGTSVTLRARTTDPGSDDLTLTWHWDDGSPLRSRRPW